MAREVILNGVFQCVGGKHNIEVWDRPCYLTRVETINKIRKVAVHDTIREYKTDTIRIIEQPPRETRIAGVQKPKSKTGAIIKSFAWGAIIGSILLLLIYIILKVIR